MTIYKLTVTNTADNSTLIIGSSAKKGKGAALALIYKDPEKIASFLGDNDIKIVWKGSWQFVNGHVKGFCAWELDTHANYKKNLKMHEERIKAYRNNTRD